LLGDTTKGKSDRPNLVLERERPANLQAKGDRKGVTPAESLEGWARTGFEENRLRRPFNCTNFRFSIERQIGTIFEECRLPIDKCLIAVWLEVNSKNSISSYEVGRHLGVTQKTAWFLQHRIRLALNVGSFDKPLSGEVEADETFIGGKAHNMHPGKRKAKGRGAAGKAVVMGLLERHGEVRTFVVDNTKRRTLQPVVKQHVEKGSEVFTDALASYSGLSPEYMHQVIDHAECYVKGNVHTNGLENYWSLFKRCIKGTHISVEPFHLFRYLDAENFRFNQRKTTDGVRFVRAAGMTEGKRLTYKSLIGEDQQSLSSLDSAGASGVFDA
jgi:transposase-like protein